MDMNSTWTRTCVGITDDQVCCCTSKFCKISFYFITSLTLVLVAVYFVIHCDLLTKANNQCNDVLYDKARNESVMKAQSSKLKQTNILFKNDLKELQRKFSIMEEKYLNSTKEIELHLSTIKDLKVQRNVLTTQVKEQTKKIGVFEENLSTMQDKIDLYIRTINELNKHLDVSISTDFLTVNKMQNSASLVTQLSFYFVILGQLLCIWSFN